MATPPRTRFYTMKPTQALASRLKDDSARLLTSINDLDRLRTSVEDDVLAANQARKDREAARAALRADASAANGRTR